MRPIKEKALYTALSVCVTSVFVQSLALAEPSVSAVNASSLTVGQSVQITGSGFGSSGPDIILVDHFETGSSGDGISKEGPFIGRWDNVAGNAKITAFSHSGENGFLAFDGLRQTTLQFDIGRDETEIYVSFWVAVEPGYKFPGSTTGPRQLSTDSSWKYAWLMDGSRGYSERDQFDLWIAAYTGKAFNIAGNDGNFQWIWDFWTWEWNRVSMWIDGAARAEFQTMTTDGTRTEMYNDSVFVQGSSNFFNRLNIPGYLRSRSSPDNDIRPVYDDIYVARGPSAAARIEITDNANYSRSTESTLLTPTSWSGDQVTATLPPSNMYGSGKPMFLFVFDSQGRRNSRGFPVDCGDCPSPPKPPELR